MTPQIATILYVVGIAGLFFLDRDAKSRVSKGLWIPVIWLMIVESRPVSLWLGAAPDVSQAQGYADGSPLDAAVFGCLIIAGVVVLSMRFAKVRRFLIANIPILLFFGYCFVSIVWSDFPFVTLKRWIKAIGDFVMVLVVLTDPDPPAATRRLFSRTAFVLLPLSMLFIGYYPDLGRMYERWTWTPMYTGVTTFKNLLGMTCLVGGLGSVWSFFGAFENRKLPHRFRHLLAHGILFLIAVRLIMIADSMTSLSCLLMGSTLIVLTRQKRLGTRTKVAHFLVGGWIAVSLCSLFVSTNALRSLGRDPTLTGRTAIWKALLSMHTNPLIGTGFESFWTGPRLEQIWSVAEKGLQESHNGYLEIYLNLGLFGVAFLAIIMVTGYVHAFSVFRRNAQDGRLKLAFFTACVIYSVTEAGFRTMSPMWISLLLASSGVPPEPRRIVKSPSASFHTDPIEIPMETVSLLNVEPGFSRPMSLIPATAPAGLGAGFSDTQI